MAVGRQPRESQKRHREPDLSSLAPKGASGPAVITQPPDQSTRVTQMNSAVVDRQAGWPAGAIEGSQLEANKAPQCLEFATARPPPPPPSTSTFQLALRGISESTNLQRLASRDRVHFSASPNIAQEPISSLAGIYTSTIRARPNVQPGEATGFAPTAATSFQAGVATGFNLGGIAGPQPNAVANPRSTTAETNSLAQLYNEWAADDCPDPISDAFGIPDGVVDDEAPWDAHRRSNDSRPQTFAQNPFASQAAWDFPAISDVPGSVGASDRGVSTKIISTESVSPASASTRGVPIVGESREMTSRRPASTRGASRKDGSTKGASVVRASSQGAHRKDASYRASESPSSQTLGMEEKVSGSKHVPKAQAASSDAAQVSTFRAEKALQVEPLITTPIVSRWTDILFLSQRHQSAQAPEAAKHRPLPSFTFSNDEITQIREYRADNKSWKWIGEKMGTSLRRLREAKDMGLFAEGGKSLSAPDPFSDEQISQIKQYRAEEQTWEWIAKETGTSIKRLRRATAEGIFGEVPVSFSAQKPISDEQISQIKKYCAEGKSWKWISREVNISKWRLLKKAAEGLFGTEGKEKPAAHGSLIRFTEDEISEIKEYRIQKKSWDWIAIKMGFSTTTLTTRAQKGEFGVHEGQIYRRNE
ncbi:hypothetical protein EPUS_06404 [Endocarpon pusillum Z07020]|uniref:Uncharacterized protein n=1 Tax=Endocarpon pusillum (strain Z07020 / HMAS-L-300199) TaxID=1263415 RepID=U1HGP6_ENDPU|nr:uncharacterized protein EPUS_06404 [Endocarpon pusillum Z07020]ERF68014.1 hypothetical protein EPUS_06404 [Endocarpon pusillum Z07020]